MGSMPASFLWQAKLHSALPVVILGSTKAVMAARSMLAIAAIVGTRDLGSTVYIGARQGQCGIETMRSAFHQRFIAITSDRITRPG